MARINSKKKGNKFELDLAHIFTEAVGEEFCRVPSSGSWGTNFRKAGSTIRSDAQEMLSSDLICPPSFPYSIEAKFYADFLFHGILQGKNAKLDEWTEQCLRSSIASNKKMLLIIKINRKITMCCLKLSENNDIIKKFCKS